MLAAAGGLPAGLLGVFAELAPAPLPTEVLEAGLDLLPGGGEESLGAALGRLEAAGALELSERGPAPDPELAAALAATGPAPPAEGFLALATEVLLRSFPVELEDPAGRERGAALMAHLEVLGRAAEERGAWVEGLAELLRRGAELRRARGELSAAEQLSLAALAAAAPAPGPELAARLRYTQGRILGSLGRLEGARESLEGALASQLESLGPGVEETRRARLALAEVLAELGDLPAARDQVEAAIAAGGEAGDPLASLGRRRLAAVLMEAGDLDAAEAEYSLALAEVEAGGVPGRPEIAETRAELGALALERRDWEGARANLVEALAEAQSSLGPEHPFTAVVHSNLATSLQELGLLEAARSELEVALAIGERRLPPGHRGIWLRHRKLARVSRRLEDTEAAARHAWAAAAISELALGPSDPEHGRDLVLAAETEAEAGRGAEARGAYERALAALEEGLGPEAPEVAEAQTALGVLLARAGDLAEARTRLERALASHEARGSTAALAVRIELAGLAGRIGEELVASLGALGRAEEAARVAELELRARRASFEEIIGAGDFRTDVAVARALRAGMPDLAAAALEAAGELTEEYPGAGLGEVRRGILAQLWRTHGLGAFGSGRWEEARAAFACGLEWAAGDAELEGSLLSDLADTDREAGRVEAAGELYERAARLQREAGGGPGLAFTLLAWGRMLEAEGDPAAAEALYRERLEHLRSWAQADPRAEGITLHDLGDARWAQGGLEEAIGLYGEAAGRKREAGVEGQLAVTLAALGGALDQAGRPAEALAAFEEGLEALRSLPQPEPAEEAPLLERTARLRRDLGQDEPAVALLAEAVGLREELGEDEPLATALLALGRALAAQGDQAEAEEVFRRCLAVLRGASERLPRSEAIALHDLAGVLAGRGEGAAAADTYREAIGFAEEAGEIHGAALSTMALARVLEDEGERAGAAEAYRRRLELLARLPERDPAAEGATLHELASLREDSDIDAAIRLYRGAAARKREAGDPTSLALTLLMLGIAILTAAEEEDGRRAAMQAEAQGLFEEADELIEEVPESAIVEVASAKSMVAITLAERGIEEGIEEARAQAEAALARILENEELAADPEAVRALCLLAAEVAAPGLCRRGIARFEELVGAEDGGGEGPVVRLFGRLARIRERRGDHRGAEEFHEERLGRLRAASEPDPAAEGLTLRDLGDTARELGEVERAVGLYGEAADRLHAAGDPEGEGFTLSMQASTMLSAELPGAAQAARRAVACFRAAPDAPPATFAATLAILAMLEPEREKALGLVLEAETVLGDGPERTDYARRIDELLEGTRRRFAEDG